MLEIPHPPIQQNVQIPYKKEKCNKWERKINQLKPEYPEAILISIFFTLFRLQFEIEINGWIKTLLMWILIHSLLQVTFIMDILLVPPKHKSNSTIKWNSKWQFSLTFQTHIKKISKIFKISRFSIGKVHQLRHNIMGGRQWSVMIHLVTLVRNLSWIFIPVLSNHWIFQ